MQNMLKCCHHQAGQKRLPTVGNTNRGAQKSWAWSWAGDFAAEGHAGKSERIGLWPNPSQLLPGHTADETYARQWEKESHCATVQSESIVPAHSCQDHLNFSSESCC